MMPLAARPAAVKPAGELRGVQIMGFQTRGIDGFPPCPRRVCPRWLAAGHTHEVHRIGAELPARMDLKLPGTDVPKGAPGAAVHPEGPPAPAAIHAPAFADVDIAQQIRVGRAPVMIKAHIHATAVLAHVPGAMTVGNIVDEANPEIEIRQKVVVPGERNAVVTHQAVLIRLAVCGKDDAVDGAEFS